MNPIEIIAVIRDFANEHPNLIVDLEAVEDAFLELTSMGEEPDQKEVEDYLKDAYGLE